MKVIDAQERADGTVTASVEFEDGLTQTVIVPSWATRENILAEARRLRRQAEATESGKKVRKDLIG